MNVLELFAGSRSIGKAAEQLGMKVFSSDIESFEKIDYVIDVLNFDVNKVPFIPDIGWFSPPPVRDFQSLLLAGIGVL